MAENYTTAGSLVIKNMMPNNQLKNSYDTSKVLDKGGIRDVINELVKDGSHDSYETINRLAQVFFDKATEKGFTTSLSDYQNDSEERHALLDEFEHNVNKIVQSSTTEEEKKRQLDGLTDSVKKHSEMSNMRHLLDKHSHAAKMALTGARGNPSQLAQGSFSPLMSRDINGDPVPVAITHSYAEGLTPAEHMAASYGGRSNTVMTQMSTSLPGALFKKLTPNLFHEVVTEHDCGTHNGINEPLQDEKKIVGHYFAESGTLITEQEYKTLKQSKKETVKVRSTMTCEAHDGVCQLCYGISANGKLPEIGENVGVIAAQSASEVLTQAVLSTKHTGGSAGKQRNPYDEAKNLLYNPENFQDQATLSKLDGKITGIEETPLKDHNVFVNSIPHMVPRIQDVAVKKGDEVQKGDFLSTGTGNPKEMVNLRGIGPTRRYLSDKLREVYGEHLDPRHFDLISRNMLKYLKVEHPGNTGYLPGQTVRVHDIRNDLAQDQEQVPITQAKNKTLAEGSLEFTPGHILSDNDIHTLGAAGVNHVKISKSGLVVHPQVPGLDTSKLYDPNWISNLSFSSLKKTIVDAATSHAESDKHSNDPIPSYVMGSEFGEGKTGRY